MAVMMPVGEVGGGDLELRQILQESAIGGRGTNRRLAASEPDESGRFGILVVRSRVHVLSWAAHSMRPGIIIYTSSGGKSPRLCAESCT